MNAPSQPREPSLLPREHGAWGQLALPLAAGLALGRPGAAALLLTAAVVLAFLAHEPLVVLLGQRGARVRGALGARAWRAGVGLGAGAAVAGAAGLVLAPSARLAILPGAALGAVALLLAALRAEKTTAGELVVASALASLSAPVALAAGAPARSAWACAVTWAVAFTCATLPVRAILLRARTKGEEDPRPLAAAAVVILVGAALWAATHRWLPWAAAVAILPVAALAVALCVVPVRPQRLTTVGWSILAASVATLVVLVAGLRLA